MILIFFRICFLLIDLIFGILFKWWSIPEVKSYMTSQLRLLKTLFSIAVYTDLFVIGLLLYFKAPFLFSRLLEFISNLYSENEWTLGVGLPFRKPFVSTTAADVQAKISKGGMLSGNRGRSMMWLLEMATIPLISRWNGSFARESYLFTRSCRKILRDSGIKYLVLYLKACQIFLQQSVAGQVVRDTRLFKVAVSRTKTGIPRIISPRFRALIRARDKGAIRFWMTLFGLFRILEFPGKVDISTITDPSKMAPNVETDLIVSGLMRFVLREFFQGLHKFLGLTSKITPFLKQCVLLTGNVPDYTEFFKTQLIASFRSIAKSSPTTETIDPLGTTSISTSVRAMKRAAWLWFSKGPNGGVGTKLGSGNPKSLMESLFFWLQQTQNIRFYAWMLRLARSSEPDDELDYAWDWHEGLEQLRASEPPKFYDPKSIDRWANPSVPVTGQLGKLSLKEEAAGKIRVFAMVDAFTQWAMAPLHDAILLTLSLIPQDGTYNQHAPVKRLLKQKLNGLWSFDLSAATDRLPVLLQTILLYPALGVKGANLWRQLLVGRTYSLKGRLVKYAVGQPMGALSSWAMLALCHHALVQYAAFSICVHKKIRWRWFTKYAILGDDIIIGDREVAAGYVKLMETLGVGINLAKSIISEKSKVGEFAKRFYTPQDCSMVPFKEVLAARFDFSELLMFTRKYKLTVTQVLRFMGFGYKVRGATNRLFSKSGARIRNLLLTLSFPGNPAGLRSYTDWLRQIGFNRLGTISIPQTLQSIFDKERAALHRKYDALEEAQDFLEAYTRNGKATDVSSWDKYGNTSIDPRHDHLMDMSFAAERVKWDLEDFEPNLDDNLIKSLEEMHQKFDSVQVPYAIEERLHEPKVRRNRPSKVLRYRRNIKLEKSNGK